MDWLAQNWFWVVVFVAFMAMHMVGHGGHGGHGGGCGPGPDGKRPPDAGGDETKPAAGHRH